MSWQKLAKHSRLVLLTLSLSLLIGLAGSKTVGAAPAISIKGITLSPAIANVDLQKGQTVANFNVMVTNNTQNDLVLHVSSVDFKSLNNSGGLAFITSKPTGAAYKYGLTSWLNTGTKTVELKAHQLKPVTITVENRTDLSPGGHYAAVLFMVANGGKGANTRVNLNQVVSTLVFVRKIDGERYGISLEQPSLPTSWLHAPTNIDLFFKNTGNIQEIPRGLVTITSPLSHEVSRAVINTNSSLVLPDSARLNRVALFATGHTWLPGVYRVHIDYRYDGAPTYQSYDGTFFYAGLPSVAVSLGGLFVVVYVVRQLHRLYRKAKRRHQQS